MEIKIVVYIILATILTIAVVEDLVKHKISNTLVVVSILLGVGSQFLSSGLAGIGTALQGAGVGLLCFLPFYLLGGMGAGDVKFMASIGTFLGPYTIIYAAALTLMFGSLFAIGSVLKRRYFPTNITATSELQTESKLNNKIAIPYAPSIALGTVSTLFFLGLINNT